MSKKQPVVSTSFSYETLEETLDVKVKRDGETIGIPKEIAFQENRVSLTPDAVAVLVSNGHSVMVEHNAGDASHFRDKEYSDAGAKIVHSREEVFKAPILLKSAPVIEEDLPLLQMNQIIISPLHLSVLEHKVLCEMMKKKVTAISFENLKDDTDSYPIVRSMSEIAGSAVMLIAGQYLGSANHGKGILLGGISGIAPAKVVIIGAGIVGEYAARTALSLGASVKVFDNNVSRLIRLQNTIGHRLWTSVIEPKLLAKQLRTCEVAVGCVTNESGRAPLIVTEEMVSGMRPGAVIIDASIDRGGCFETSEVTSHESPIFMKYGVIHYCVPNIPSGFARTASQAISNVLMPLLIEAGDEGGLENLAWHQVHLRNGFYLFKGHLTNFYLSQRFDLKYTDLNLLIASQR
ncbi:MAG: alanine dehydrogenase [Sphingobacteriales bacterium 41-5]|nr:MAG: alanine dehydrogenase [Sphingobacteriales bacterium 41-5]